MMEWLPLAIGVGLVVSLLCSEFFGLTPGGLVVPGYLALAWSRPVDVVLTVGAGFVTYAVLYGASQIVILYGRRRTVLAVLMGYLVGYAIRWATGSSVGDHEQTYTVVGYILPGLIAIWLDRQGLVETLSALVTVSVIVRLVLVLVVGAELVP